MFSTVQLLATVTVLASILYTLSHMGRRGKNLPPGPPTLPLIGNLHQIPSSGTHFKFTEWAAQYGGIFSLKLGPATAVVITDRTLIKSLIDKKSATYSSRPDSHVANDLITHGDHTLVMKNGEKWRLFRKLIKQSFCEEKVEKEFTAVVEAEATQMCWDLLQQPRKLMKHPKRFSNSIIMSLVFGIRTPSVDTPHMQALYTLMEEWSKVMETGATPPVDIFPFLRYLPQCLFRNWRSRCLDVGRAMDHLYQSQVSLVLSRRSSLGKRSSFLDTVLDQQDKLRLTSNELNYLCGVLLEGGSDTSSSILLAFLQAMIAYPEVQRRAHAAIDAALPPSASSDASFPRSPAWAADFARIPYVNALVKESMRWRPVTPLAFPHATSAADTLHTESGQAYSLPAGTTVILNVWGLHHDAARPGPPPEHFVPERFLGSHPLGAPAYAVHPDPQARDHYGYGAGRRLCPGIHLAERNLWVAMAKLLWAFEIRPLEMQQQQQEEHEGKGEGAARAVDTDPRTGYCEGFLCAPKDFGAEIYVRGEWRKEVLRREYEQAQQLFGTFGSDKA